MTVLADGNFRLVVPPALTVGLAAGDVFAVDPASLRPQILRRSGNLTIWLYPAGANDEARQLEDQVEALGGTFDGSAHEDTVFIFTLPVNAGFPAIEAIFGRFVQACGRAEWHFGNVYADDDETPLGWWEQEGGASA